MASPWPKYTFSVATGRYRGPGGKFVPFKEIRNTLDKAIDSASSRMRSLSESLQKGNISLNDWERGMRENIKNVQIYSASAARGGWAQMTPADYGKVGTRVKEQYRYLDRFAGQIRSGEMPLDGRFLSRTDLYSEASRKTYHVFDEIEKQDRGYNEYRNIKGTADHCEQCVELSYMNWQPIGSLPEIGDRICMARCKCYWQFRKYYADLDTGKTGFRT